MIGQEPSQKIPTPELEPKILSFEEFIRRDYNGPIKYNNFPLHFGKGIVAREYRKQEHYKKFESEHPEMAKSLCARMQSLSETSISLKPSEKELYEVYKIMRSYGFSDQELFA
jgi:hypothetical protein